MESRWLDTAIDGVRKTSDIELLKGIFRFASFIDEDLFFQLQQRELGDLIDLRKRLGPQQCHENTGKKMSYTSFV